MHCYVDAASVYGDMADERAMARTICCLLLIFGSMGLGRAQQGDARENRILVLERLWNEAQVNRDASSLNALVGDRFVNTEWDGEVTDKAQFLAGIKDPRYKAISLNIQDVKVNFYGDTAVVTGVYHNKGISDGKPYEHSGRFTDTWVAQGGGWQCVASHTSLIKK